MFLVDVSQNKGAGVANKMILIDDYITVKTAYNTNRSFVAVCCSTENQVIAPCAILFHAPQVISPRWVSMDKVKQICSIGLWERKKFTVTLTEYRPGHIYYKEMVRKPGKVLCYVFLLTLLGIDPATKPGKIQKVDICVLIQLTKKRHCDYVIHAQSTMCRVTDLPTFFNVYRPSIPNHFTLLTLSLIIPK